MKSTRRWELERIDHPAVKPLIEYKKLYRIWVAHGWSWLQDWVRDGRFRPEYLAGGTVTGRWVTNGGGGAADPQGDPPGGGRRPGLAAGRRRRRPDGAAGAGRDLPRPRADGGRGRGRPTSTSPCPTARSPATARRPSSPCWARSTGRPPGTASRTSPRCDAGSRRRWPTSTTRRGRARRGGSCGPGWGVRVPRRRGPDDDGRRRRASRAEERDRSTPARARRPAEQEWVPGYASSNSRARGRFARNFVVQGSAADWTLLLLAALRRTWRGWRPSWSSSSTTR